jgi:ABC-type phosphate transport system permease subunit
MRSALIGLGVLLFFLTIIVNLTARSIVGWNDRRMKGA